VGIPAGGIFTGAEVHKTPAQQAIYGGTASSGLDGQFDPCYRLACDTFANFSPIVLDQMADAAAHCTNSGASAIGPCGRRARSGEARVASRERQR
jgi:hypothetical protein